LAFVHGGLRDVRVFFGKHSIRLVKCVVLVLDCINVVVALAGLDLVEMVGVVGVGDNCMVRVGM